MLKLKDVAQYADMSHEHLCRLKNGNASIGMGVAHKVARLTGRSPGEVIDMTGQELFVALETAYMRKIVSEREG